MNKQTSLTKETKSAQKIKTNISQSKSITKTKPATQSKTASTAKTVAKTKPVTKSKTVNATKPVAQNKPKVQSKSVASAKPTTQSKATAQSKTKTQTKPVAQTKSKIQSKPVTQTKPVTQSKSVTKNNVTVKTKPVVVTKPIVQSKAATQSKSVAQTKPAVQSKSTAQSKPTIQSKPVTQDKNKDLNKTAKQSKTTKQSKTKKKKLTIKERTKRYFDKIKLKIKAWFANKDHRNDFIISVSYVLAMTIFVTCIITMVLRIYKPNKSYIPLVDPYNYTYARYDDDKHFIETGIDDSSWSGVRAEAITNGYATGTSKAPQTSTYLGTYDNVYVPEVRDERETYGVTRYPKWNTSSVTLAELDALRAESRALAPWPTWKSKNIYDSIDSEGYLLRNGNRVQYPNSDEYRKLYKHTASNGMYGGNVSDDEPRIVKEITCTARSKLAVTQITGLYAPAGELIKVEISEADLKAAGGSIRVYIGQNYNLDQHVSMENKGNSFNRLPDILSIFQISASNATLNNGVYTAYVGSFIGGPIYFRANDSTNHAKACNISVKFSGGVKYQHFILGVTTQEEYELNKNSSAPYFDLEIYEQSVRFTTSKYAAYNGKALKDFSYEDCTDAAVLWDKITEVSTRVAANGLSASSVPVVIIGDCYIAAGAAFANPGRNGVVCPPGWLAEALNYSHFVNSGCWGTMHEYNHCWQGYGVGNGGEVTNNATTLVSYSLYTRISAGRTEAYSWGNGSWNRFTDPSRSLAELLNGTASGKKYYDLSLYATLLHNIGQDNFIKAARGGREAGSTPYYNNLVNATHYDMTYYFTEILHHNIGSNNAIGTLAASAVNNVKSKNYPMFVPVSSVYQVGRSIIYDNEKYYIRTAQPFSYGSGEYIMDFNNHNNFASGIGSYKNLVIPDGFTVSVVSVTQPKNGKVELLENNMVKYTPSNNISTTDDLYSGEFRVKLRIIRNDLTFIVEDVDLIINLKQSNALQRTTYIYDNDNMILSPEVYNKATNKFDFGDYLETETINNVCAQEKNCEIWAAGINYYDQKYIANSTNKRDLPIGKTVQVLEGKMYFSSPGTYRIALRGRGKLALYISLNQGKTYELAVSMTSNKGTDYINGNWRDYELTGTENWVYFKAVLLVSNNASDFLGIGSAKLNNNATFKLSDIAHCSAYRDEIYREEETKKFITDYHFKNEYTYSYSNTEIYYATNNTPISVNYDPWDSSQTIDKMFDGDGSTSYHSIKDQYITEEKPFELIVDLRSVRKVNTITFTLYHKSNAIGNLGMVKDFKLYGSTELNGEYKLLLEKTGFTYSKKETISFSFEDVEIRYYKLVVTKTDNGRYFAMNRIVLSHVISYPNGKVIAPNDFSVRYIGENVGNQKAWTTQNVFCNFGQIYESQANGDKNYVELHFTGSRFAYFAYKSSDYGTVDIYVDNKLVASNISLNGTNNMASLAYVYTDKALSNGEHVVKIVGKTGKFNLDSFVVW